MSDKTSKVILTSIFFYICQLNISSVSFYVYLAAPVSVPAVSQTCSSPEKMTVKCSSEGDAVEFILTLNGHLLIQTRNHSLALSTAERPSVSHVSIDLQGQLTGNFMCQVWNNVSRHETSIKLTACKGTVCVLLSRFKFVHVFTLEYFNK